MSQTERGLLEGVPSRTSFVFGAITGIAVMLIVGYIFGMPVRGDRAQAAAGVRVAKNEAAVVVPEAAPVKKPSAGALPVVTKNDHVRGDANAPLTIVEYSDFQCPYCEKFHPTMQRVMSEYAGKVKWVYRDFPLSFHPNALPAAEASECVAEQGGDEAFWPFADAMFANQSQLGNAFYESQVEALGLDVEKFRSCVSSGKYKAAITQELNAGAAAGVTGTPGSFFVDAKGNAELISGAVPFEQLQAVIEASL